MKRTYTLILASAFLVALTLGRGWYDYRSRRSDCFRSSTAKLNSLEPSPARIEAEAQDVDLYRAMINQIEDSSPKGKKHMADALKDKADKLTKDQAEGKRNVDRVKAELATCLEEAK